MTLPSARRIAVAALFGLPLLVGCGGASGHGHVSGHLYMVGGPLVRGTSPSPQPLAGTIEAKGPGGRHTAKAGPDGLFTLRLAPGTYTLSGTSPNYDDGNSPCGANVLVTIARDEMRTADVFCQVP